MTPWSFCNCRTVWCWLDALFECKVRFVCDRHDRHILVERVKAEAAA